MIQKINKIFNIRLIQLIAGYGITDVLAKVTPFVVLPIILKYLTPDEFGLVSNFSSLVQLFLPLVLLNGHTFLTIEYHKRNKIRLSLLIENSIAIMVLMLIITVIMLFFFDGFFHEHFRLSNKWINVALLTTFFKALFMLSESELRMSENIKIFGFLHVGQSLISAALALFFVVLIEWGWEGRLYALWSSAIIVSIVSFYFIYKNYELKFKVSLKAIKSQLFFAIPLLPHTFAAFGKGAVQKGIITSTVGLEENGLYATAGIFLSVSSVITAAIFSAINPEVLKTLALIDKTKDMSNNIKAKMKIVKISYISLLLILFTSFLSYLVAYVVINFYLESSYLESLTYLPYLLVISFLNSIYSIFSIYIINEKKTFLLSKITMLCVIIEISLNFVAIQFYGMIGLIWASIFGNFLRSLIVFYFANKLRAMPWLNKKVFKVN